MSAPSPNVREIASVLAPFGALRIGVYGGSPTSLAVGGADGDIRGVGAEAGLALAARLGVPAELVVRDRPASILAGLKAGEIDVALTNATPERAVDVDFGPVLFSIELGFLVAPSSSLVRVDELGSIANLRVGVTKGSSSERAMPLILPRAAVVAFETLEAASEALACGGIEAFATNKAILAQMIQTWLCGRILDGHWGLEQLALAIPKGRAHGIPLLTEFTREATADGTLDRWMARAGLLPAAVS